MAEENSKKRSTLGCWIKPLILSIACVATGARMMSQWATLSGTLKALSILFIFFGSLLLLPIAALLLFQWWARRVKKSLYGEFGDAESLLKQVALRTQKLYEPEAEYREATPDDFAHSDLAFYDQTEEFFKSRGFRGLGDRVNKSIEAMGKPSPPIRAMVSSGGTVIAGIYHLQMGEKSFKIIDIETEFSDGNFLATANTAGLDLSTPPPEIERRQFVPETAPAALLDAHEAEMAWIVTVGSGRRCVMVQTLNELLEMQKRMHYLKRAARRQKDYADAAEVNRVAENRALAKNAGGEKKESFVATIARAKRDAAEAKARTAEERGPAFLTGTGRPEQAVYFEAPPEPGVDIEGKTYEGVGGMIKVINAAKDEREKKLLAQLPAGASRLGGLPDLPLSLDWPMAWEKKIPFLAQIDLSALPRWEGRPLPADGWLYVFGLFDNVPEHKPSPIRVLLYRGDRVDLIRASRPHPDDIWPDCTQVAVYELLELQSGLRGTDAMERLREKELKVEAKEGSERQRNAGHLFGEPSAMDDTAGDIADAMDCSGDDWINLLTLHSQGSMEWSDSGYLNVVIRRSDLERGDFSKACAAIWSS